MGKVDTKAILDLMKQIEDAETKAITKKIAQEVGKAVTAEMKALIAKGISPIRGNERFPAYKRAGEKGGYPANVRKRYPVKRNRPVNLSLTGDFLNALTFKPISGKTGYQLEIGFFDSNEAIKEQGHREGAGGQPKRPIIPQGNEEFAVSIQEVASDLIEEAMEEYVKKI